MKEKEKKDKEEKKEPTYADKLLQELLYNLNNQPDDDKEKLDTDVDE